MVERHHGLLAVRDGIQARLLPAQDVDHAIALLDAAEAEVGAPLVDEAERDRLRRLAAGDAPPRHWHAVLARGGGEPLGYAGTVLGRDGAVVADLAPARPRRPGGPLLLVLLDAVEALARGHGGGRLEVWIRHADPGAVSEAVDAGYSVARRLAVVGHDLGDTGDPVAVPPGVRIRPYAPDGDDDAVVALLAQAYAGTPDGGWDRERFEARRGLPWFEPADLLVAERDGRVTGVHWLKRRGDRIGEVYNLAVSPAEQGGGLGAALLDAGMDHLRRSGCREVLLWVDRANERAVRLYASHGFRTRWEDICLARTVTAASQPATSG